MGAIPASAAENTVAEQVAKLGPGRKIKVKLNSGEMLKGRMGSATAEQFSLEPRDKAQGTARVIQFTEAQSVKPDGMRTSTKWIIGVAIWGAIAIVGSRV
jgi:carbon monoxide dehydrogenase subunit G